MSEGFMNKRKFIVARSIGLAGLVCLGFAAPLYVNGAVVDGDFGSPNVGHAGLKEYFSGHVGPWDAGNFVTLFANGTTDPITGQTLTTPDGTGQALLLRGSTTYNLGGGATFSTRSVLGSVSQDLHGIVAGGMYQVGFDLGALQGTGMNAAVQVQVVYSDNTGPLDVIFQNTFSSGMNWGAKVFDFTVPTANPNQHTSLTLKFIDVGGDSSLYVPAAIDNVSLTAIPEPYQYGLVGLLGMLGLAGRQLASRKKLA